MLGCDIFWGQSFNVSKDSLTRLQAVRDVHSLSSDTFNTVIVFHRADGLGKTMKNCTRRCYTYTYRIGSHQHLQWIWNTVALSIKSIKILPGCAIFKSFSSLTLSDVLTESKVIISYFNFFHCRYGVASFANECNWGSK